jgi:hypothetical protein
MLEPRRAHTTVSRAQGPTIIRCASCGSAEAALLECSQQLQPSIPGHTKEARERVTYGSGIRCCTQAARHSLSGPGTSTNRLPARPATAASGSGGPGGVVCSLASVPSPQISFWQNSGVTIFLLHCAGGSLPAADWIKPTPSLCRADSGMPLGTPSPSGQLAAPG